MNTPEELYVHLRRQVNDGNVVAQMVRARFPDWQPDTPRRPMVKTEYIRSIKGPDDEGVRPSLAFDTAIGVGTSELADALKLGRGKDKFTWTSGYKYSAKTAERYPMAAKAIAARELALSRAVSRDPCPLCGVRGDIGCKHQ